ncbi:MAG TPA: hypothetical protein VKB88_02630 [Bryobacteraceae bacterium]|nr:hypothetical protein [Bryobacteraceae bacterium]
MKSAILRLWCIFAFALSSVALAQAGNGTLSGKVTSADGAAISNAP